MNIYAYFSDANIWPRGLPLEEVRSQPPALDSLPRERVDSPIQQGLADENPDVDAIYRLVLPLPLNFKPGIELALAPGVWCPFNSQNTVWWPEAYPLLYMPAYCSIRMTDIWRSFIAQRIAWENGWSLLFESSTVWQDRNDHSLIRDFKDEIPGYLNNRAICEGLEDLHLKSGIDAIGDNLKTCYEFMIKGSYIGADELTLVDAWLKDLQESLPEVEHRQALSASQAL